MSEFICSENLPAAYGYLKEIRVFNDIGKFCIRDVRAKLILDGLSREY
jgi:hypothetical protein